MFLPVVHVCVGLFFLSLAFIFSFSFSLPSFLHSLPRPLSCLIVDGALELEPEGTFALGQRLGERELDGRELDVERHTGRLRRLTALGHKRRFRDVNLFRVQGHTVRLLHDLVSECQFLGHGWTCVQGMGWEQGRAGEHDRV